MASILNRLMAVCIIIFPVVLSAQTHYEATEWLTSPDRSALVMKQEKKIILDSLDAIADTPSITIDDRHTMQSMDGFGFALTGGSAELIMRMTPATRHALLEELFGTNDSAIGVSYLRVSIGSSDMNATVFTYDDMPMGQTDLRLRQFKLGTDLKDVIPVLQEILKIAPTIKILGTPWTAPSWMKTNENLKGGSLKPEYYTVYAEYLARYIKTMSNHGVHIDAITPQNEPLNPKNTPSMVVSAQEEAAFIRQSLGPTFRKKHLKTKIILYDHNCDRPDYPLLILTDRDAAQYVDGSAFHLYGGAIEAMTEVHDAHPEKNLYFTEQMVIDHPEDGPALRIAKPEASIVIGAISNWSRNVLLWNLAADPMFGPHTSNGGCPICEGAITLDGDQVTRNAAFYTIAQIAKFVRPGAVRIGSTDKGIVPAHVAFRNGDGTFVLLVANTNDEAETFSINFHGTVGKTDLEPGAVATYVW